ncbi:MAG: hypothetical protein ACK578_15690 [Pirellula sp.]
MQLPRCQSAFVSDKTLAAVVLLRKPAASALPLTVVWTIDGEPQRASGGYGWCPFRALLTVQAISAASAFPLTGLPISRIFKNTDLGYQTVTVERPELDEKGKVVKETKGKRIGLPKPDSKLRNSEDVPLGEDIEAHFQREVVPHVPDAWIDHDKTKIGYEIPFNRHFYVFKPPRELDEIDKELKGVTDRIVKMIGELSQ